jgi:hypothetical protein
VKVAGVLVMVGLTIVVGLMFLGGIARYTALVEVADWTVRDAVGATVIAFLMGFVVLSSVLAFLAAVVEGRKLSRRK